MLRGISDREDNRGLRIEAFDFLRAKVFGNVKMNPVGSQFQAKLIGKKMFHPSVGIGFAASQNFPMLIGVAKLEGNENTARGFTERKIQNVTRNRAHRG
jgi:hypothetical protein